MSKTFAVVRIHRSASVGFVPVFPLWTAWPGVRIKDNINEGPMPKRMISARDGSKRDKSVSNAKNLNTLAESAIPEVKRPSPNSKPARWEEIVWDIFGPLQYLRNDNQFYDARKQHRTSYGGQPGC